jgi:PIN domain nuclease of toxin-antitoxin system
MQGASRIFVSAASIWEAAIKAGLGKLQVDPNDVVGGIAASGFLELPVLGRHAARVSSLPFHHKDPFDRLLVAQAMEEPLRLLTTDRLLQAYSPLVQVI